MQKEGTTRGPAWCFSGDAACSVATTSCSDQSLPLPSKSMCNQAFLDGAGKLMKVDVYLFHCDQYWFLVTFSPTQIAQAADDCLIQLLVEREWLRPQHMQCVLLRLATASNRLPVRLKCAINADKDPRPMRRTCKHEIAKVQQGSTLARGIKT